MYVYLYEAAMSLRLPKRVAFDLKRSRSLEDREAMVQAVIEAIQIDGEFIREYLTEVAHTEEVCRVECGGNCVFTR